MIILNILLGILGLGIVILVHELGHFTAAKLSGITVEALSLGWGKKLWSYTYKNTEYRLSLFPIGGYCKMKGEELFNKALENKEKRIPFEKGSLYSASPWKRIITYLSGPLFNLFFSIIVLSIVWYAGFTIRTYDNRIVLMSDYPELSSKSFYPSDIAGLETKDRIISVNGNAVNNFNDFQSIITLNADKELTMIVDRNGYSKDIVITPELDKDTGAGFIGVAAWVDPVIASVKKESSASIAGLKKGDIIITANGQTVNNYLDFYSQFTDNPAKIDLTYHRNGTLCKTTLIIHYDEKEQADTGIVFKGITFSSPEMGVGSALLKGITETFNTVALVIKSIGLLFKDINLEKAVSGPIRITYLVGEVATKGFSIGISEGFSIIFRFLSFLSVSLFFMNLLPIPALDGGMILITIYEIFKRDAVAPRFFYRYQMIGFFIIMLILFLTTFGDISFLINR